MKRMATLFLATSCLLLTACSNDTTREASVDPVKAINKVNFKLPANQKWALINDEQAANGYAKSYRAIYAKGICADQSFYINYGHSIKTPLKQSMQEVVKSLASSGCTNTRSKIEKSGPNMLIFTASADHCTAGRPVSQVFKVFNMADGQYSIVYSANPNAVPNKIRQQMKSVVEKAGISTV